MSTYNGWTNYETWRVSLEIFDDMSAEDFSAEELPASEFAELLKDYVDELLCGSSTGGPCGEGLALSYARAFVSSANYYEIAEHMLSEVEREEESEE